MPTTVPLGVRSVSVTLNGSGAGQARLGPLSAREVWQPALATVSTTFPGSQTAPTNESICKIYAGDQPIQTNFRDATFSGSSGDASDRISADVIKCGQYVWAVWSGGDAGVTATLQVTGTATV